MNAALRPDAADPMNQAWLQDAYETHGRKVMAYLRARLANAHDCEELLQQTFVTIATDPSGYFAADSHGAWLIGIARNHLRDHIRRRRMHTMAGDDLDVPVVAVNADDRLEEVRVAIAGLPAAQREVLGLRLRDELSYAEIAEALRIPVGTVRSRIHHAVEALRRQLGERSPATVSNRP